MSFKNLVIIFAAQLVTGQLTLAAPHLDYEIVRSYPHSVDHFTQGLEVSDGIVYESIGGYGKSKLLAYSLAEGTVIRQHKLSLHHFGEGLTIHNNSVFQLTWKSGKILIYNRDDFQPSGSFKIKGQGWGLTNNGKQLIYSNGSANLHFISPNDGQLIKILPVTENGVKVNKLNELEWVDGLIYANIWQSNDIVIIDPGSGRLISRIDLSQLLPHAMKHWNTGVLNGIAYNSSSKQLFITGKNWPIIYEIRLK